GADKGIIYLIKAWAKLNYKDAQLVIAGRNTEALLPLVRAYGRGSIYIKGEVKDLSDFYNSISVLCAPSSTEGFGICILEAMSHGRPVIATTNTCLPDVDEGLIVPIRNPSAIAEAIS